MNPSVLVAALRMSERKGSQSTFFSLPPLSGFDFPTRRIDGAASPARKKGVRLRLQDRAAAVTADDARQFLPTRASCRVRRGEGTAHSQLPPQFSGCW